MSLVFPINKSPKPPWNWVTEDNVLRSNTDAGYVISRPRYTRARDTLKEVTWDLTDLEVVALQEFYKTTTSFGTMEFTLTLSTPNVTITKTVQFTEPPTNIYQGMGVFESKCSFREV